MQGRGPVRTLPACDFAEGRVWDALGGRWQCLHGCYCQQGVSVEWHAVVCDKPRDWARSFHRGSVELCFSLSGHARLTHRRTPSFLGARAVTLYAVTDQALSAWRLPGGRNVFLTVECSPGFLAPHLTGRESALHPVVRQVLRNLADGPRIAPPWRLAVAHRKDIERLRHPPVSGPAAALWYHGKALELMAHFFFPPVEGRGGSAGRRREISRTRVQQVIELLSQRLAEPPRLGELGRRVGCSPYHLSRTFSKELGMTIPQCLRQIRMERAARLLKSGKFNGTETAREVGYNSLSHFSQAICETMGCCPGLYPLGVVRSLGAPPLRQPAGLSKLPDRRQQPAASGGRRRLE